MHFVKSGTVKEGRNFQVILSLLGTVGLWYPFEIG
jgi:hypothetical protein